MPTRAQTVADAIEIFNKALYPKGLDKTTTWLGIYQTLLWYEPVNWVGFKELPHIIDADNLRPSNPLRKAKWTNPNAWQRRANAFHLYLSNNLNVTPDNVIKQVDQLLKHHDYRGMQRQNSLGIAFAGLIKEVLEKWGGQEISYQIEVDANTIFSGITFPGRSKAPRIDLLAKQNDIPIAIITAKWSLRHDRVNDITNECPVYKTAYSRIYRQVSRRKLLYYVITNEFNPARLKKVLGDPCVDGVIHVHKPGVLDVCGLDGTLSGLIDLSDFMNQSNSWE